MIALRLRCAPVVKAGMCAWLALAAVTEASGAAGQTAPAQAEARMRQADTLYRAGDLRGAIRVLSEAARLVPEAAQVRFMLANAWLRAGQYGSAVESYRAAARLRPEHVDTHLNLGFALYHAGDAAAARDAWREAVRRASRDAMARMALAVGELAVGQRDAALFHYVLALDLEPQLESRSYRAFDVRWGPAGLAAMDSLDRLLVAAGGE